LLRSIKVVSSCSRYHDLVFTRPVPKQNNGG